MSAFGKTWRSNGLLPWAIGLLLIWVVSASEGAVSVSCGDAVEALIPCEGFLLGSSAPPPNEGCCSSARQLESMADTREKRKEICECFEQTGPSFGVKPERVSAVPKYCNLNISFPADPHYNCNK